MKYARILMIATATAAALAGLATLRLPAMRAQEPKTVLIDALCGANPVNRNLHDRLTALAGTRGWDSPPAGMGCEWATGNQRADVVDRELAKNAQTIGEVIRRYPGDTLVILINSMLAARLGDLRPGVVNPRLVTRELYLFATNPDMLCGQTSKLRVGWVRGTARRAEIVNTIAHENTRRAVSDIQATDFPVPRDFAELLGASSGGLDIVAFVHDDFGGAYELFKEQVLDKRSGAVRPVSPCTNAEQGPPRLEKTLDGSVSYLTVATPPSSPAAARPTPAPPVPLVALLRPGQEPAFTPQKSWFARMTESVSRTVETAGSNVRVSDFKDFPVVLAIGPSAANRAGNPELKQALSHSYFEGMFDSLTAGLSPCKAQADALFGLYLINSYLEDRGSVEKGCALQAYYELVSPPEDKRTPTVRKNIELLNADRRLANCLSRNPPPAAPVAVACVPDVKRVNATRDYGPHYAYYELGLKSIEAARSQAGSAREQSLRKAETCLRRALELQPQRKCGQFSQGLFYEPYEPSLPLGVVRLKGGK